MSIIDPTTFCMQCQYYRYEENGLENGINGIEIVGMIKWEIFQTILHWNTNDLLIFNLITT